MVLYCKYHIIWLIVGRRLEVGVQNAELGIFPVASDGMVSLSVVSQNHEEVPEERVSFITNGHEKLERGYVATHFILYKTKTPLP